MFLEILKNSKKWIFKIINIFKILIFFKKMIFGKKTYFFQNFQNKFSKKYYIIFFYHEENLFRKIPKILFWKFWKNCKHFYFFWKFSNFLKKSIQSLSLRNFVFAKIFDSPRLTFGTVTFFVRWSWKFSDAKMKWE